MAADRYIPVAVYEERTVRVWAAEEDDAADDVVVGRVPLRHARDRAVRHELLQRL